MRTVRLASGISVIILTAFLYGCGPHMKIQQSVKPYEQKMMKMPSGTVPTNGTLTAFTNQQAKGANPIPGSKENVSNGRIFYNYYCNQCHGNDGMGNGPVGQSYVPKPTDLTSSQIAGLSDSDIYRRMLVGVGHSPVLEQTVLPEHRWPLVLYVRTLAKGASASRPAGTM